MTTLPLLSLISLLAVAGPVAPAVGSEPAAPQETPRPPGTRTIRAQAQPRPGAPAEEIDMTVHPVPTDLPSVGPDEAGLEDGDLVLGVVVDGVAMAYPIRYLALFEIIDDRVGTTPLAPSW